MRILNPVCSELVLPLFLSGIDDVRRAIKKVEELTGWKLGCIVTDFETFNKLIFYIRPEDLLLNDDRFTPDIDTIPNEEIREIMKSGKEHNYEICVGLVSPDIPTNVWIDEFHKNHILPLIIRFKFGYFMVVFEAYTHTYSPHFEPLFKIALNFKKIWHPEDGGRTDYIDKWLIENHREEAAELARHILEESDDFSFDDSYARHLLSLMEGEDDKI